MISYKHILFSLLWAATFQSIHGQSDPLTNMSARSAALANIRHSADGENGLLFNPASLVSLKQTLAMASVENPYFIEGLGNYNLAVGLPLLHSGIAISINQLSISGFDQQQFSLAYGRMLSEKISIGASVNYNRVSILQYGKTSAIGTELGVITQMSPDIKVGLHIINPIASEIVDGETLNTHMELAVSWQVSDKVSLLSAIQKELDYDPSIHIGVEYALHPTIRLRVGGQTNPAQTSLGVGINIFNNLILDTAASYHQSLGVTPTATLKYKINRTLKEKE